MSETQPEMYDVKQLSVILGCSQDTVRRLSESRRMPRSIKIGHLVRWRIKTIHEWIEKGCPRR